MRIAVAGGTGTLGRHIVDVARERGHEVVVLARSTGVDLVAGTGLSRALEGCDAVLDSANATTLKADEATRFFRAATGNLTAAAARAGIAHVVGISIVSIDRVPHQYYAGKLAQEGVIEASDAPWTLVRASQFHEFAGQIFAQASFGPLHLAPKARIQPLAARSAAEHLVEIAEGPAQGRARDITGPREEQLDEMVRAHARATGHTGPVIRVSLPGAQMKGMRDGLALPGPDALRLGPTFAQWIEAQPARQRA